MQKLTLVILTFLCLNSLNAQNATSDTDLRAGTGLALLGSGDMWAHQLDVEFNQTFSPLFTYGFSAALGRSNSGVYETASFFQTNANIFLSPFRNDRQNDFRIGTGLSYNWVSDAFIQSRQFDQGQVVSETIIFDQRNTLGVNIIIENTFSISEQLLLGLKLFSQPYFNGDINSGVLLKFGVRL